MHGKSNQTMGKAALGMALTLMFTAAPSAFAAGEKVWYGGVGVGQSKIKEDMICNALAGIPGVSCSEDKKDTAWRIYGGNQFSKYGAVEFGYRNLGEGKANIDILGNAGDVTWKAKGFDIALVGTLPVSDSIGILGRIGMFHWDVDASAGGVLSAAGSEKAAGSSLTYGIGAQFGVAKDIAMRVELERMKDVGNDSVGKSDLDVMSVGVTFNF
jgi:OOP family OmpA-OmpF porin